MICWNWIQNCNILVMLIFNVFHVYCIIWLQARPAIYKNLILKDTALCVVDTEALTSLSAKAASRLHQAFHPRTRGTYLTMFRTFVAFCVHTRCVLADVNIKVVLSFLECLVINDCSVSMIESHKGSFCVA